MQLTVVAMVTEVVTEKLFPTESPLPDTKMDQQIILLA